MPRTLTYSIVTTTVLILGITLSILSTPVHAQTQGEVCNLYTPSVTTPSGYGASYNVFNQSELMLSIYCNEDKSVTVTAGNNDDLTYVYNQGYYYANNQWNNFTYTCTDETIADIWCTKQATKTLTSTPTSGTTYLVSYTCQWRNNTWNCGCHNSACTTNHWQLQGWTIASGGGGGTSYPPVTIDPNAEGVIFHHDFEQDGLGVYTVQDLIDKWGWDGKANDMNGIVSLRDHDSTWIVNDPNGSRGKAMRVFHKKGVNVYSRQVCCSGVGWETPLPKSDEYYFAYDVMFSPEFDYDLGGKLPGLYGGQDINYIISGGRIPDGYNGWSGRTMFKKDAGLALYVYHVNKPGDWGHTFMWSKKFTPGKWHTLEIRYVMNTPSVADGYIQGWFDGQLAVDTGKILLFRKASTISINAIIFNNFFGGRWPSPKDQYVYFDNFVVSTNPITH